MKYRIYTYTFYGNNKNGYEVNDISGSDITVAIDSDDDDDAIIKKVKATMPNQQRKKRRAKDFRIEGRDTLECFIWITYKHIPLCELRPENEEDEEEP
jgi:hypothetical protein